MKEFHELIEKKKNELNDMQKIIEEKQKELKELETGEKNVSRVQILVVDIIDDFECGEIDSNIEAGKEIIEKFKK
jgi:hypothetical protein